MKHVHKSVLLWYSPHEMFELVTAVESYPSFLPWCDHADVLERHTDGMTARLGLAMGGVRHAFTTRNLQRTDESIAMQLVDGPFSRLDGLWQFRSLGDREQTCKVEFDLRYAFSSPALETVMNPVFSKVTASLVDSFVRRAEQVYGAR